MEKKSWLMILFCNCILCILLWSSLQKSFLLVRVEPCQSHQYFCVSTAVCVCKGGEEQSSVACCNQHLHAQNCRFTDENLKADMGCIEEKIKQELFFLSIWLPR